MTVTVDTPTDTDEQPVPTVEPLAPSDKGAMVSTPSGSLEIMQGQTEWTAEQRDVLEAVGIPRDVPPAYMQAFLHLCLARGLDPFAGETTVMQTEDGWVPIIKIDGLRSLAVKSGEYEGLTCNPEWGDDAGNWYTAWPRELGRPSYSRRGAYRRNWREAVMAVVATEEVEVFEAVFKVIDGKRKWVGRELAERWQDGKGVLRMLSKCAEAAALRQAFPRETDGFYTPEEMDRVKSSRREDERARAAAAGAQARAERYAAAVAKLGGDDEPCATTPAPDGEPLEGVVVSHGGREFDSTMDAVRGLRERALRDVEPTVATVATATEPPAATAESLPLSESDRIEALRGEVAEQAEILGTSVDVLINRVRIATGTDPANWDSATLLRAVKPMRAPTHRRLQGLSRYTEAVAYAQWVGSDHIDWPDILFGRSQA